MMTRRGKRLFAVSLLIAGLGAAVAFGFAAFQQNMMYFYTPTDFVAGSVPVGANVRLGGMVETGSVTRAAAGLAVSFVLWDCTQRVAVRYEGILPDLFREGQGIVATGKLAGDGTFQASEVLAKHDANYMPPQLKESMTTPGGHVCEPFKAMKS